MRTQDVQQCLNGFKTILVIPGPYQVQVHKARDVIYADSDKHGYFLTVDFKFRPNDALYIGTPGWEGWSKAEAIREAKALAAALLSRSEALLGANKLVQEDNTATNRITRSKQADRLNALVGKYSAELIQA